MVTTILLSMQQRCAAYAIRTSAAFQGLPRTGRTSTGSRASTCTNSKLRSFSLNAQKSDRDRFYSVDDLNERSLPPIMDSQTEDEGYGAYDYQPDIYDLEAMNQEPGLPDSFFDGPPVDDVGVPSKPKKKASAPIRSVEKPKAAIPTPSPVISNVKPVSVMENSSIMQEEAPSRTQASPEPVSIMETSSIVEEEAPSSFQPPPKPVNVMETTSAAPKEVPTRPPSPSKPYRPRSGPPPRSEMMSLNTHFHASRVAKGTMDGYLEKAAYGAGATTEVDSLKQQMEELTKEIYEQNKGKEFNPNSPRQVSEVLFGYSGETTNKETLEGMAGGGNRMAEMMLQYRALKATIKRYERRQTNKDNDTHVTSAMKVARPDAAPEEADPLMLLDASAYIYRAYYSMPPIHRADGMPTGAVMGFCNMLNRMILNRMLAGERPRLVLVFDAKGKTFRHDLYPEYKGHRPTAPVDLIPQFDLIREAATAYGVCQLEATNFEADDVIATLATMALEEGIDTNILSSDKDLMQLVTLKDQVPSVHMIDPMTMSRTTYDQVVEKWGVAPELLGDVLALAGDSADNIPGVPGIGPKIAAALIGEFGTLDTLLEQVDSVKQKGRRAKLKDNQEQARLSRVLVELDRQVPMEIMSFPNGMDKASELRMEAIDGDRILAFYDVMGFRDLKRRVEGRLKQGGPAPRRSSSSFSKRTKAEVPKPEDYSDVPF